MIIRATSRKRSARQSGYMLLVVLLMVALLVLSLTAVAPRIVQQVKRDREEEMIHRGVQYARAIRRFYRKFGRYPTTIDQLKETNNMRFLRKEYADPMSPGGKWKVLHPGDVKIAGSRVGTPVSAMAANTQQPSAFGSTASPTTAAQPGATTPGGQTGTSSLGTTSTSNNNPVLGGFIIGVASMSNAEGIHEFDGKSKYSEWYFIYDPTIDRGGLITGPYTGKIFSFGGTSTIPGATPAGQQPGAFGQQSPGGLGQQSPGGFGQPIGPGTPPTPPKQ